MTSDGKLLGANVYANNRYGDLQNKISTGTAAVAAAKNVFKENLPYSREYDENGNLKIHMNLHFLKEARRQLAGNIADGTSTFSVYESKFWNDFIDYQNDGVKTGETLLAVQALGQWFKDEIMDVPHEDLNRNYGRTHKWRKMGGING